MTDRKTESRLVGIRLPNGVYEKAKAQARRLGYIKPNGEANISEYMRNLIINDKR